MFSQRLILRLLACVIAPLMLINCPGNNSNQGPENNEIKNDKENNTNTTNNNNDKNKDEYFQLAQKTDALIDEQVKKLDSASPINQVVGLKNCLNTCYMNAILQSLIHSDLGKYTQVPFNDIYFSAGVDKNTSLFKIFYDLGNQYKKSSLTDVVDTSAIAQARSKFMPDLNIGAQDDATDYLRQFLSQIGSELNMVSHKFSYQETPAEEADFSLQSKLFKAGKQFNEYSIITDLFGGYLKSSRFLADGTEVASYEQLTTLLLDFPTSGSPTTLSKLLESFATVEPTEPGTKLYTTKQLTIHKAPKNLIIQLKRFKYKKDNTPAAKISDKVDYPAQLSLTTAADGKINFELFAVVIHHGTTLASGHYTARIKTNNSWYIADDNKINPSNETDTLNQEAYVLFYKKI